MIFRQLLDPESYTYTYLLGDPETYEAIIIDPVLENVDDYLKLLRQLSLKLKYVLDTHVHADHITGSGKLRELTHCKTAMHESSKAKCIDVRLMDGQALNFGKYQVQAIHTPGHTPCHLAYRVGDRLFTGDSLFINGCGRTDFQGGSPKLLWKSVTQKLFDLPPETLVYPGHDYRGRWVSNLQEEKTLNSRFKNQTEESFIELMNHLDLPQPKKIMEAVPANEACGLIGDR